MSWTQAGHIAVSSLGSLNYVSCDPFHELIWSANEQGYISSLLMPTFEKYTSFKAHEADVRQLIPIEEGVFSISQTSISYTTKEGVPRVRFSDETLWSLQTMVHTGNGSKFLIGGLQDSMLIFDLSRGRVIKKIDTEGGTVVMKKSKMICCGTDRGEVLLRDPRTLNIENRVLAHTSGISDLDVSGNMMITCGFTERLGNYTVDPYVNCWDLRSLRPLPVVQFTQGALFSKFHPLASNFVFVASQTGCFDLKDSSVFIPPNTVDVEIVGGLCTSFDVSSTGDVVVIGDSLGDLHIWTTLDQVVLNESSLPLDFPSPFELPSFEIQDDIPFSSLGMPHYQEMLLSAWPTNYTFTVGVPSPQIDPNILANMKVIDFIGYAPNPGIKRNTILANKVEIDSSEPKFLSEQQREKAKKAVTVVQEKEQKKTVGKLYDLVKIRYGKLGVEDFDFGFYNKTKFGGLETNILNCYCNSVLQILYFLPHFRRCAIAFMSNDWERENHLATEMGFLFRMLDDSKGLNCQATNFLRVFNTVPNASALGLFEPEIPNTEVDYGFLIQNFLRFLLEKLHKEFTIINFSIGKIPDPDFSTPTQFLFGSKFFHIERCMACNQESKRKGIYYSLDFVSKIPGDPARKNGFTFKGLLEASLDRITYSRVACQSCNKNQQMFNQKICYHLPNLLCINAGTLTTDDFNFSEEYVKELQRASSLDDPMEEITFGSKSWVPPFFQVQPNENGKLLIHDIHDSSIKLDSTLKTYELKSIVFKVISSKETASHLVAHIKVPDFYHQQSGSTEKSDWYLFNDFLVSPISGSHALHFDPSVMIPCIFVYGHTKIEEYIQTESLPTQIDPGFLLRDLFISTPGVHPRNKYTRLNANDLPAKGFLCAIDSEFICTKEEESQLRPDGTRQILRPQKLNLARVSVVRGWGNNLGVPFIDDYIISTENIVDYLTKYSGIKYGDLDPRVSNYRLTSLKWAYMKLRILIDIGCIFVGHGLKQDFRIINIVVPPEQVIDTVELFRLKAQRKISLRFLSYHLLEKDIQQDSHCSVEDSRTALEIYLKFLELKKEDRFEQTLEYLYEVGRRSNWEIGI